MADPLRARQVVRDRDVSQSQGLGQNLFNSRLECCCDCDALERREFADVAQTDRSEQCHETPVRVQHQAVHPLPTRGSTVLAGFLRVGVCLVPEHQSAQVDAGKLGTARLTLHLQHKPVLFSRLLQLRFRCGPSRSSVWNTAELRHATPVISRNSSSLTPRQSLTDSQGTSAVAPSNARFQLRRPR